MPIGNHNGMKTGVSIDKAGRIVLPHHVRRQFHLLAGDRLDVEIRPDGVFLRSRSRHGDLVEENGLLVHGGEATDDLMRAVERARADRDADVLGLRS
jgi:AbrB family looped-hinge helix DNA binding protein